LICTTDPESETEGGGTPFNFIQFTISFALLHRRNFLQLLLYFYAFTAFLSFIFLVLRFANCRFCSCVSGFVALGHFPKEFQRAIRPCVHVGLMHFLRTQGENDFIYENEFILGWGYCLGNIKFQPTKEV